MKNNSQESLGRIANGDTAGAKERSMVEIIKDIAGHIQEMVRCEIRLAGTDLREEAVKRWTAGRLMIAGAVIGFLGLTYVLLSAVYALALVMPAWAGALIVGGTVSVIAMFLISSGMGKWKTLETPLKRTAENVEENVEWVKQHAKS